MNISIGKKLDGRYEIQQIIGVGGMAVVYKAYDSIDHRMVALKVLKEEYITNGEFRRLFKNEYKAVALLSHPYIVKVYDISLGDKIQYIVMEYIDGQNIKQYITRQKILGWNEALHFTAQILRALQHAHDRGIVHRDIKPQNIMMLEDSTIKVTDFGIARFVNSETRTLTGKAIGSVHYISPEQARGGHADEKSDIYSVGVMLFEMLTGILPFEGDSAVSVAVMQLQQDPRHPREINANIPKGLEDITLRAMQKDPSKRYQSASEMQDDIEKFKRNPNKRFTYKYFADESPTKHVDAVNKIKGRNTYGMQKNANKVHIIPTLAGIAVSLLFIVLIVVFAALYNKGYLPGNSVPDMQTPNLVGKSFVGVKGDPQYKDFTYQQETTEYSDTYAEGIIISQNPPSGEIVKEGSLIKVFISKGSRLVTVPDITNNEQSMAISALKNDGFINVQTSGVYDDKIASGYVVKTDPVPTTSVPVNAAVTVYVSMGPDPSILITVPDLAGLTYDAAISKLDQAGLKIGSQTSQNSSETVGTVISQNPAANSQASRNTAVDVVISSGYDTFFQGGKQHKNNR